MNIISLHGDQEHITIIKAISAGGVVIPPLIIIKGKVILHRWFADIMDDDYLIGVSDSGYSNDVLFFQWLQHWEAMSRRTQRGEYQLLLLDGYDSHLTWTALQFCEQQKVVVILFPPHTTHFMQPLDVALFQQWKHYHAEAINHSVRRGCGNFDRSAFLRYIEKIRELTFTPRNIKAGFRKCGYWPFRLVEVLQQLVIDGVILDEVMQEAGMSHPLPRDPTPEYSLGEIWSSPIAHTKLVKQADAIQDFLRSSVEPPSPGSKAKFRGNIQKFMNTVKAKDILQDSLTSYIWDSSITQGKAARRKTCKGNHVQKGGVVYAGDVERDISGMDSFLSKLGDELEVPQKIYAVRMKTMVNDQFRRNKLAKQMRGIAEGTIKLRPEKPGGEIIVKPGWTEWTTKGMGRGKAPRKKPQKRKKLESEEDSEAEVESEIESYSDHEPTTELEPEPVASSSNIQSQGQSQRKRRRQCNADQTAGSSSKVSSGQASKASRAAGSSTLTRSAKGKAVVKQHTEMDDIPIDPLLLKSISYFV